MNEKFERDTQVESPSWPDCPLLERQCLLEQLGQALGEEIMESLVAFILTPQPGSRLTLQRNQNEFTSQFTGPISRSSGTSISLSDHQALRRKLSSSN